MFENFGPRLLTYLAAQQLGFGRTWQLFARFCAVTHEFKFDNKTHALPITGPFCWQQEKDANFLVK